MLVHKMFLEFYYSVKPQSPPFTLFMAATIMLLAFGRFFQQWKLILGKLVEMLTFFNSGRFYACMYTCIFMYLCIRRSAYC